MELLLSSYVYFIGTSGTPNTIKLLQNCKSTVNATQDRPSIIMMQMFSLASEDQLLIMYFRTTWVSTCSRQGNYTSNNGRQHARKLSHFRFLHYGNIWSYNIVPRSLEGFQVIISIFIPAGVRRQVASILVQLFSRFSKLLCSSHRLLKISHPCESGNCSCN